MKSPSKLDLFKNLGKTLEISEFRALFVEDIIIPEYRQIPTVSMRLGPNADRASQGDPLLCLVLMMYLVLTQSSNANKRYPRLEDWKNDRLLGFHRNQWFAAYVWLHGFKDFRRSNSVFPESKRGTDEKPMELVYITDEERGRKELTRDEHFHTYENFIHTMATDQVRTLYTSQPVHIRSTPRLDVYRQQYEAFDNYTRASTDEIDRFVPRGAPVPRSVLDKFGAVRKSRTPTKFLLGCGGLRKSQKPIEVPIKIFVPRGEIAAGDTDLVDMDGPGSAAEQLLITHLNLRSHGTNLRVAMQERLAASGLRVDPPPLSKEAVDADIRLGANRHLIPTNAFFKEVFPNDGVVKSRAAFIKAFPRLQRGATSHPAHSAKAASDTGVDAYEPGADMMASFVGRETEQATTIAESVAALTSTLSNDSELRINDVREVAAGKFKSFYDLLDNNYVIEFTPEHVRQVQQYLFPTVVIDPATMDFNSLKFSDQLYLKAHQFIDAMYLRHQEDSGMGGCVLANGTGTGKTVTYLYAIYTAFQDIEARVAAGEKVVCRPSLIVVPPQLVSQVADEARDRFGEKLTRLVYYGSPVGPLAKKHKVLTRDKFGETIKRLHRKRNDPEVSFLSSLPVAR